MLNESVEAIARPLHSAEQAEHLRHDETAEERVDVDVAPRSYALIDGIVVEHLDRYAVNNLDHHVASQREEARCVDACCLERSDAVNSRLRLRSVGRLGCCQFVDCKLA